MTSLYTVHGRTWSGHPRHASALPLARGCPGQARARTAGRVFRLPRGEFADGFDNGVPIVDLSGLRMDHAVVQAALGISGDAILHYAEILCVTMRSARVRDFWLWPIASHTRT